MINSLQVLGTTSIEDNRQRLPKRCIMESNEFLERFDKLIPGESMVYHRGSLSHDRRVDTDVEIIAILALRLGTPQGRIVRMYQELRKSRSTDFGQGLGELSQKLLTDGMYEYVITKRKAKASTIDEKVGKI